MELEIINNNANNVANQNNFFNKIILETVNRGAEYMLKALPIQENIKDILKDVKKCLEKKDYSNILKTVINSSIREGAEILGIDVNNINNFDEAKDIAFKGGLREGINASIDIVSDKYIKNNLLSSEIVNYTDNLKNYIKSKNFNLKLDNRIGKILKKQESVNELFNEWHKNYDKFNLDNINKIFKDISKNKAIFTSDMNNDYKIIKNITEFVNNTNSKLSNFQMEVCKTV